MHVEFHGAARTVTGSCTLLEADGTRILVDCGQFQGDDELERLNRGKLAFDPPSIRALVMTHAHIDHVGRVPLLTTKGFRGEVIATRATQELALVMLMDSAKIQEEDARHGGPMPTYGEKEVRAIYKATRTVKYGQPVKVGKGITVTLFDAGHILGSAHVLATMTEGPRTIQFGVSGDVGSPGRPVVADPTPFRSLDLLQVESTYGDRDHKSPADSIAELDRILDQADGENGVVLIPAFALGRTQDILYHLNARKNAGGIPHLDVYVDSPLATRVTRVFEGNSAVFDDDAKGLLRRGDDPFDFPGLHFVADGRESERLSHEAKRCVIIASSGMCQSGRVVGHLAQLLPRPSTKVVIVGYQAPGTLGRRLVNGVNPVYIRGRQVPVHATLHTLGGFSAHAGRHELLDWIRSADRKPSKVFLCHGEPAAAESLGAAIREELHLETYVPSLGERVEI